MKVLSASGFVVCGMVLGYLLAAGFGSKGGYPSRTDGDLPRQTRANRPPAEGRDSAFGFRDIVRAAPKDLPGLMKRCASISDPIERPRWVAECLSRMTAENWKEMVDSFGELSDETGRDMATEWSKAMVRSGQVAGAEAMEAILAAGLSNNRQQGWDTLYGWSTKDPKAALEWLKKAESSGKGITTDHYTALLAGAALTRPADALALMDQIPPDRRSDCAGHFIWSVVMNGGTAALPEVLDYASKLDQNQPGNATLSRSLIREAAEKMLWQSDHHRSVPDACAAVNTLIRHGADPTSVASQALQKYRWYAVPDRLNLLHGILTSNAGSLPNASILASGLASGMGGSQDNNVVRKWINQNPESPLVPYLNQRFIEEIPLPLPEAE